MEIVTATVFSNGRDGEAVGLDQILVEPRHGLLAVAHCTGTKDERKAGVRIALEAVRAHVDRNDDILDRFRRTPTAELRKRILAIIDDGFTRAAQELFAYARRRDGVHVTMDVVLLLEREAFIGHIGDGRVYLVRRGLVHQLTVDHVATAPNKGGFNPNDLGNAENGSDPNAVRVMGPEPRVQVEALCMELAPEDRFVVSTGHTHRAVPESILHSRFTSEHLHELPTALNRDANGASLVAALAQCGSGEPFTPDSAQSRLALLAPIPLFTHCNERELRVVAKSTRPRQFTSGQVIFEQGQPGTELYLVVSGDVDIVKDGHTIVTLGPGSNFGEMSMLDEPNRSASAIAASDSELMVIPRAAFFAMLKGNPVLAVKILWNMLLRLSASLRRTSARLADLERQDN